VATIDGDVLLAGPPWFESGDDGTATGTDAAAGLHCSRRAGSCASAERHGVWQLQRRRLLHVVCATNDQLAPLAKVTYNAVGGTGHVHVTGPIREADSCTRPDSDATGSKCLVSLRGTSTRVSARRAPWF